MTKCQKALAQLCWKTQSLSGNSFGHCCNWDCCLPEIWPRTYMQLSFLLVQLLLRLKSWFSHILDWLPDLSVWNATRELNVTALKKTYPMKPILCQMGWQLHVSVWSVNQPPVLELGFGRPSWRAETDQFHWPCQQPPAFSGFVSTVLPPCRTGRSYVC